MPFRGLPVWDIILKLWNAEQIMRNDEVTVVLLKEKSILESLWNADQGV